MPLASSDRRGEPGSRAVSHAFALAPTILAAFAASLVEFVEALTIILAVGVVRGWRSSLLGAGAGLALLALLVGALGRSLTAIPLPVVQLVVGTLLLLFGLRWLRKAVLRAAGVIALHDEAAAFEQESAALRKATAVSALRVDAIAFTTAFKAVLLEGLEVVFIVIAIGAGGAGGALLWPAIAGAALALLLVMTLGLALHRPLASLPENQLKFGVGVLLSAFGMFWVGEGIGLAWPAGDWALLGLSAIMALTALVLVVACKRAHRRTLTAGPLKAAGKAAAGTLSPSVFAAFLATSWKLFVDDGWLALGILAWVGLAGFVEARGDPAVSFAPAAFPAGLLGLLAVSALRRSRS